MKINIAGKEFEIDNETISKAIEEKTESISVTADDIIIRTTEEEETFKTNLMNEGQSTAYEIARKNVLKGLGIDVNGAHKNDESTLNALKSWTQTQVDDKLKEVQTKPDERVKALETDLETLKGTLGQVEQERDKWKSEHENFKKTNTIRNTLLSVIPDNVVLPKEDMFTILQTKIKTDVDENGNIYAIGQDGQPIKDSRTLQYKPINEVINGFFESNPTYMKGATGGNGGGDSGSGGTKQTIESFMDEMKENNIPLNSPKYVEEMNSRIKDGLLEI